MRYLRSPPLNDLPDLRRRRFGLSVSRLGCAFAAGLWTSACTSSGPRRTISTAAVEPVVPTQVPPFSAGAVGDGLPPGWEKYIIRRDRTHTHYGLVNLDGRTVLHAQADSARSGLHTAVRIDPRSTPWFSWTWRANDVHEAATVSDDDAEDTPARIVLGFDGDMARLSLRERLFFEQVELFTGNRLPYATLVYVWDGQRPAGEVVSYPRSSRIKYQVVESGRAHVGQWLTYERNVWEDFQRVFGEPPPGPISSVGLLTDSDDLKNQVQAWYGDMAFHEQPEGVPVTAQIERQP